MASSNGGLSAMRMLSVAVVVLTAMVLFPLRMVSARKPPANCVASGPCELCTGLELSHESCQATKRRQEYICRGDPSSKDNAASSERGRGGGGGGGGGGNSEEEEDDDEESEESEKRSSVRKPKDLATDDDAESSTAVIYRSCDRTAADDVRAVIWFEAWMALIGGLSMWGVRVQKTNNQTLYDKRLFKKSRI